MEIEIRAKVENLDLMKEKLERLGGEFFETEQQDDYYFKPKGKEMETQKAGSHIIRIRKTENKSFLTLKALTDMKGVWHENETEVSDVNETREIIERMGYAEVFSISKTRLNGKIGEINLCLDSIEQLGDYLEVEIIAEDGILAKEKLIALFEKLEITEEKIEHRGYARIISEDMGIKFE